MLLKVGNQGATYLILMEMWNRERLLDGYHGQKVQVGLGDHPVDNLIDHTAGKVSQIEIPRFIFSKGGYP